MIPTANLIILFRLLVAHILADFFLQHYKWIVDKQTGVRSPYLYYHVAIVGGLTYLLLADWTQWQLPLFIMVSHFLIDWWKSSRKDCTWVFILDQLLHVLMLVIGWLWYIGFGLGQTVTWANSLNTIQFWVILSSYLLLLRPAGFLIAKATNSWQAELDKNPAVTQGLTKAGTWIGYLERVIILTILLMGNYSAVGFLIAAKSIFRFSGTMNKESRRKQAEYILIGTLMSFFLAMGAGILARYFIIY